MNVIFVKPHRMNGIEYYPGDAVGLLQPDAERLIQDGIARQAPEGTLLRRASRDPAADLSNCVTPTQPKKTKIDPEDEDEENTTHYPPTPTHK